MYQLCFSSGNGNHFKYSQQKGIEERLVGAFNIFGMAGEVGIRKPWHFCLDSHFNVARIQTLVCCEHCCLRHKNPTCARPAAGQRDVGSGHCQHLYMLEATNLPAPCRRVVSDPTSIFQNSYLCYLSSTTQFTFRYKGKIQILASLCP